MMHTCPDCERQCRCTGGEYGDEGDCAHDCTAADLYEQVLEDLSDADFCAEFEDRE